MKKVLLSAALLVVLASGMAAATYRAAVAGRPAGAEVAVTIERGSSGTQIAHVLESRQVIGSPLLFRLYLRLKGGPELRAGEYLLRKSMPFGEVLDALVKGPPERFVKLVLPEGLNIDQTAARVGSQTHITEGEFAAAVNVFRERPAALANAPTLEGLLYPKTYFVSESETAGSLVTRLVRQFEKETNDVDWNRSAALGVSPFEALVIASLIEEEAKVEDERPLISAVIHNRYRMGMKLEIDATVQYAVRKYEGQKLTQSDLEVDSPYNTRRYAGIPPGPISSPRVASILAALDPALGDALYYVLSPDCKRHVFTSDYQAFLRAKQLAPEEC